MENEKCLKPPTSHHLFCAGLSSRLLFILLVRIVSRFSPVPPFNFLLNVHFSRRWESKRWCRPHFCQWSDSERRPPDHAAARLLQHVIFQGKESMSGWYHLQDWVLRCIYHAMSHESSTWLQQVTCFSWFLLYIRCSHLILASRAFLRMKKVWGTLARTNPRWDEDPFHVWRPVLLDIFLFQVAI